jgi:hypothetical protein
MMDEIDEDIRVALRRAGITIPDDRYAAMREAYLGYRALTRCLHEPLPYPVEPAALYLPERNPPA